MATIAPRFSLRSSSRVMQFNSRTTNGAEPNTGDGMIAYTAVRYTLGRWTMRPKSRPAGCRSSTPRPRIIHLYVVIAARIYLFMRNRKELRQIAAHLKGVQ